MGRKWADGADGIGGEGMKIKQSTFYAFRILYRLDKGKNRVVTSKEIAEKEEYSWGMILKILRVMRQNGIVCAHQGRGEAGGGFSLKKKIEKITFLEIVRIMESVDLCANLDEASREKETQMFLTCSRMNEALETLFSQYTVRDLFEPGEAGCILDVAGGNKADHQCTVPLKNINPINPEPEPVLPMQGTG